MQIICGKEISEAILEDTKRKIEEEKLQPTIGVVLVGDDAASKIYVSLKEKAAQKIGIKFHKIEMQSETKESEILEVIEKMNADENIDGIIVQLPLPDHLDKINIIQSIDPQKDVDGFNDENIELFFAGHPRFYPVFPQAILKVIEFVAKNNNIKLDGKNAIIIGNSQEFGRTMQKSLKNKNIIARYFFQDDVEDNAIDFAQADIIVTACGVPNLISEKELKRDVIIVDGGITRINDKVVGDVDNSWVQKEQGYVSPVPGGVGPVTIACLLQNVYLASRNKSKT